MDGEIAIEAEAEAVTSDSASLNERHRYLPYSSQTATNL